MKHLSLFLTMITNLILTFYGSCGSKHAAYRLQGSWMEALG